MTGAFYGPLARLSNRKLREMDPKTDHPDISVIIVSWNVRELLRANLTRLFSLKTDANIEVFVVDNYSHDGTAWMVRKEFPQVHLITNAWDAGFAGPNDQALRLAKGDICILLNPDMLVDEGAFERAAKELIQDRGIGVLGIKLIGQNGKPVSNVRRFPTFGSQLAILLKLQHLFPSLVARYMATDFDYDRSQDVDQVRGSFFAFRREMLERVGYLDDGYHIWFEEVDFCKRVKAKGLRVRYCADARARDYVGKSASQMSRLSAQRIFTASMVRYFRKWHPSWQAYTIAALRPIALASAAGADAVTWMKNRMFV